MLIKKAIEMFIKIYHGDGTELVKDAPKLDSIIGLGLTSILGRHQRTTISRTALMEIRSIVTSGYAARANLSHVGVRDQHITACTFPLLYARYHASSAIKFE
jgi:hypothetical protein